MTLISMMQAYSNAILKCLKVILMFCLTFVVIVFFFEVTLYLA